MNKKIKILGIPVRFDKSFIIIILFQIFILLSPLKFSDKEFFSLLTIYGVISVFLHEMGHALSAKKHGIEVKHISLNVWGGITRLLRYETNFKRDMAITFGGPKVNLILFIISLIFIKISGMTSEAFLLFPALNLTLFVGNMIPILPFDGGNMVLSLCLHYNKDYERAHMYAYLYSSIFSLLFLCLSIFFSNVILVMMFAYLLILNYVKYHQFNNKIISSI